MYSNCRDLTRIDTAWSVRDLKASLGGGQSKVYLVPIQKSLSTKHLFPNTGKSTLKEKCHSCKKEFLIKDLRKHLWECDKLCASDDDDLLQPAFDSASGQNENLHTAVVPEQMHLQNSTRNATNSGVGEVDPVSTALQSSSNQLNSGRSSHIAEMPPLLQNG